MKNTNKFNIPVCTVKFYDSEPLLDNYIRHFINYRIDKNNSIKPMSHAYSVYKSYFRYLNYHTKFGIELLVLNPNYINKY